jgi:hypothetical protein
MIVWFAVLQESDAYEPQGNICSLAAVFVKSVTKTFFLSVAQTMRSHTFGILQHFGNFLDNCYLFSYHLF